MQNPLTTEKTTANLPRANGTNFAYASTPSLAIASAAGQILRLRLNPVMPFHKIYSCWMGFTIATGAVSTASLVLSRVELYRDHSIVAQYRIDAKMSGNTPIVERALFGSSQGQGTNTGTLDGDTLAINPAGTTGRFLVPGFPIFAFADELLWTIELATNVTVDGMSFAIASKSTPVPWGT